MSEQAFPPVESPTGSYWADNARIFKPTTADLDREYANEVPWWVRQWCARDADPDAPPPTESYEATRARALSLGLPIARTNPGLRSRALDRIRAAIQRWWR